MDAPRPRRLRDLADHLAANPDDIARLRDGREPTLDRNNTATVHNTPAANLAAEDLKAVLRDRAARHLAGAPDDYRLEADHIKQYATTRKLAEWAGPHEDLPAHADAA